MGIQFTAMMLHRFGTFAHIMANTDIDVSNAKVRIVKIIIIDNVY